MAYYFSYIEENLEKIKNPNDVDIIKPAYRDKGVSLYARINNGEAVRLTEPVGKMHFPFEPIYWLCKEMGRFYWDDFGCISNQIAINKKHLTRLVYIDLKQLNIKSNRVQLCAYFDDKKIVILMEPLKKYFFKTLKLEIEKEMEMQFEDITEEVRQQNELNQ